MTEWVAREKKLLLMLKIKLMTIIFVACAKGFHKSIKINIYFKICVLMLWIPMGEKCISYFLFHIYFSHKTQNFKSEEQLALLSGKFFSCTQMHLGHPRKQATTYSEPEFRDARFTANDMPSCIVSVGAFILTRPEWEVKCPGLVHNPALWCQQTQGWQNVTLISRN